MNQFDRINMMTGEFIPHDHKIEGFIQDKNYIKKQKNPEIKSYNRK